MRAVSSLSEGRGQALHRASRRSLPGFISLDVRAKDSGSAAWSGRAVCEHGAFWERKAVVLLHGYDWFLGMEPSTVEISLTMESLGLLPRAKSFVEPNSLTQ